jgi:hypothetical protein
MEVVGGILEKVKEGTKLIIHFAPGQRDVDRIYCSKIKPSLRLEPS